MDDLTKIALAPGTNKHLAEGKETTRGTEG